MGAVSAPQHSSVWCFAVTFLAPVGGRPAASTCSRPRLLPVAAAPRRGIQVTEARAFGEDPMSLERFRRERFIVLSPRASTYQAARAMADNHVGAVLVKIGRASCRERVEL